MSIKAKLETPFWHFWPSSSSQVLGAHHELSNNFTRLNVYWCTLHTHFPPSLPQPHTLPLHCSTTKLLQLVGKGFLVDDRRGYNWSIHLLCKEDLKFSSSHSGGDGSTPNPPLCVDVPASLANLHPKSELLIISFSYTLSSPAFPILFSKFQIDTAPTVMLPCLPSILLTSVT